MSPKWAVVLHLSTFEWVLHIMQNHLSRPLSFLSLSTTYSNLLVKPQVQAKRKKGVRVMGILSNSLWNLLMFSGPAQTCVYHSSGRCRSHLMMEYCFTCPTLWLSMSDHTLLMMDSSGCMLAWWQGNVGKRYMDRIFWMWLLSKQRGYIKGDFSIGIAIKLIET